MFPELRRRLHSSCIPVHLIEIDLRWGLTQQDTEHDQSVSACLQEVEASPFFIGLLGSRFGFIPSQYSVPKNTDTPEKFLWLGSYPKGRSVTELEMVQAVLRENAGTSQKAAFFYFRDPRFLESVPAQYHSFFLDPENESKLVPCLCLCHSF